MSRASQFCRWADSRTARLWPVDVPGDGQVSARYLGQGLHPLASGGLGEADAVAAGEHDVSVVE